MFGNSEIYNVPKSPVWKTGLLENACIFGILHGLLFLEMNAKSVLELSTNKASSTILLCMCMYLITKRWTKKQRQGLGISTHRLSVALHTPSSRTSSPWNLSISPQTPSARPQAPSLAMLQLHRWCKRHQGHLWLSPHPSMHAGSAPSYDGSARWLDNYIITLLPGVSIWS